ncbi:MAG: hypothetical protein RLZZ21_255 [Planctomycetota bacterium]|jgi:hypothetical protein
MAWHDTWTAMKKKAKPKPQGQTRKTGAVPKRATAKSTAAKGRRPPSLG